MEPSKLKAGEDVLAQGLYQNLARTLNARGTLEAVLRDACSLLTDVHGISSALIHRLPSIRWKLDLPSISTDRRSWPGPAIGTRPKIPADEALINDLCAGLKVPIEYPESTDTIKGQTTSDGIRSATLVEIPGIGALVITGDLPTHSLERIGRDAAVYITPAAHAALNGELLARTQDQFGNFRSLERQIAETLARVDTLEDLGLAVNELCDTLFTIEYTAMYFIDPATGQLKLADAKGLLDWEIEDAQRTAWDRHPGHVIRTGDVVHVHDTENDPEFLTRTSKRLARIRSRCYLPVHVGDQVVGTLGLASTKLAAFDDGHVDGVRFIADLAGLTWIRIREQEARQRRERLLHAGGASADLLVRSPHWHASIDSVLSLAREAFDVDAVHLVDFNANQCYSTNEEMSDCSTHLELSERFTDGAVVDGPTDINGVQRTIAARIDVSANLWGALVLERSGINTNIDPVLNSALRGVANSLGSAMTRDELQLELVQAHKMEAIGLLAGGIAHDFNNLLWPILAYSESLRERSTDPDEKSMLSDINLAAERAASLVEQILFMSRRRIDADDPVYFGDIVKEVADITTPTLSPGVTISVDIDENTGSVLADRTALHRLVLNLCSNARTAMKNSSGTLHLETRRARPGEQLEDGRDTLVLEVRDEGTGMTEDVRARLFEPYFTTQQTGRGTGLGLTIAHRVISELDGQVDVRSAPGEGSTFTVKLPRTEDASPAPTVTMEALQEAQGERILVVDDDPAVLATASALLESLGYATTPMNKPTEALALLQEADVEEPGFDLILTDLTMPGIDGLQLAREASFLFPRIPVIVVTGFGDECEKAMRAAPISAFLHKPITRADLGAAVRTALDEAS